MAIAVPAAQAAPIAKSRGKSALRFGLTTLGLVAVAATLFFSSVTLNGVADGTRAEIAGVEAEISEKKAAIAELKQSNDLQGVRNNELSSTILELDAKLDSTEGFLK